jgi:DNA-binding NarL/FixJ family response regulator
VYEGARITIGILDNDRYVTRALEQLKWSYLPQANVLWTVKSGKDAIKLSLAKSTQPDALLVDMSLEGMSGIDVCREIRSRTEKVTLVGMTSFSLETYYVSAIQNGAEVLIDKSDAKAIFAAVKAIENMRSPRVLFQSHESKHEAFLRLSQQKHKRETYELTQRETEILDFCINTLKTKEIAEKLCISESTVKAHIKRACEKLGAKNRTQAAIIWKEIRNNELYTIAG